jgi:hypothetical protein
LTKNTRVGIVRDDRETYDKRRRTRENSENIKWGILSKPYIHINLSTNP